ncbi:uncharacterized protein LOC142588547 [Dermacentor variabilis]|uniref:uncharacterized protein LOC142588547 n=1 Tax=Dermacentor variabilis TaxID=34621 RepID=UPI003F5BC351
MCASVRDCIDRNGPVDFHNLVAISIDNFMVLLEFYLKSTFISFNDKLYVQRQGICIGSCVAPVLCDIFLASIDRDLHSSFDDRFYLKAFRYVDDFLILLKSNHYFTVDQCISQKRGKPAVVPYVHKVSHNLKKVATRFGVPIVFSAPRKLAGLCPRISRVDKKSGCQKKHTRQYVKCVTGVIYEIPLKCGKAYVGQTGRCVNDRAREHELSVTGEYTTKSSASAAPLTQVRISCSRIPGGAIAAPQKGKASQCWRLKPTPCLRSEDLIVVLMPRDILHLKTVFKYGEVICAVANYERDPATGELSVWPVWELNVIVCGTQTICGGQGPIREFGCPSKFLHATEDEEQEEFTDCLETAECRCSSPRESAP